MLQLMKKTVNGRTTYTISAADTAAKYDFLTNAKKLTVAT